MRKATTILLWISLGLDILYIIASIVGVFIGGSLNPMGTTDTVAYGVGTFYQIVRGGLPLFIKLILMLIILFSMKSESERIVTEVIAIVLFSGIGVVFSIGFNYLANWLVSNMGSAVLAGFAYINSVSSWGSFLHTISNSLLVVAAAFAIAYKKLELADLRRIREEQDV